MRKALAFAMVALAACGADPEEGSPPPRQSDAAILELQSADDAPTGVLSYGGEDQAGELGTHCWSTRCVDFIGPPTPKTFTQVRGDVVLELAGDGTVESLTVGGLPEEKFGLPEDEREVRITGGSARLDLEPGRYMLVAFVTWPGGDGVLSFGLEAV